MPAWADAPDHAGDGPANLAPTAEILGELNRPTLPTIEQASEPDPAGLKPRDLEVILKLFGRVGTASLLGKRLEAVGKLVRLRQRPSSLCSALGGHLGSFRLDVALLGQPGR